MKPAPSMLTPASAISSAVASSSWSPVLRRAQPGDRRSRRALRRRGRRRRGSGLSTASSSTLRCVVRIRTVIPRARRAHEALHPKERRLVNHTMTEEEAHGGQRRDELGPPCAGGQPLDAFPQRRRLPMVIGVQPRDRLRGVVSKVRGISAAAARGGRTDHEDLLDDQEVAMPPPGQLGRNIDLAIDKDRSLRSRDEEFLNPGGLSDDQSQSVTP